MATALINQPPPFESGSNPAIAWEEWRSNYELYEEACEYNKKKPGPRRALLLHVLGQTARKTYKGFNFPTLPQGEHETSKDILDKFDELYKPYKNVTQASAIFNGMTQKQGQTIDEFVAELKIQANDCDFGDKYDRLVGDRIIFGIRDPALRERLFRERSVTLDRIIHLCKSAEISKKHALSILTPTEATPYGSNLSVDGLNKHSSRNPSKNKQRYKNKTNSLHQNANVRQQQGLQITCTRCGTSHCPRNCPAYGKHCSNCGKFGHFAKMCKQKRTQHNVATLDQLADDDINIDSLNIGELSISALDSTNSKWFQIVNVNGYEVTFKLDTGSDVNILPQSVVNTWIKAPKLLPTCNNVTTFNGETLKIKGECYLNCTVNNITSKYKFLIVSLPVKAVLGANACEELALIKRLESSQIVSAITNTPNNIVDKSKNLALENLLEEFKDVFVGLGQLPGLHKITIRKGAIHSISAPRKIPSALEVKVKAELENMEKIGIIKRVTEPTDWVHPIIIAYKKNGNIRICLDPRKLNLAIKREHYHIPTQEELFTNLHGCTIFSLLDASTAFWQLTLDEDSSKLCTFATPWGRYRFLRLPFGVNNAPELFQRTMDELFRDHDDIHPYFDDILLAAKDPQQHFEQLKRVLEVARANGLKLNRDKMKLGLSQINYLGHVISDKGISPDPGKVSAIAAIKAHKDKSELMRFLGMTTYLTKFIPNFSEKTHQLRSLLKTNTSWSWDENYTKQFNSIKELLMTAPVLRYFDKKKPITISTDASSFGIGSVLLQDQRPIAYASAALNQTQQGYAQIEKELLAIVFACEHFHYYILGNTVEVHTDHKPLIGLQHKPLEKISPRMQRFLLRLQRYDIKLSYVPGKHLTVADTLSRAPNINEIVKTSDIYDNFSICMLVTASTPKLKEIQTVTAIDPILTTVAKYIKQGWPERKSDVSPYANEYFHCKDELHILDGLICRGQRLVLPAPCQKDALDKLHMAHRGITACQSKARQALYWPTMNKDIENLISRCQICQQFQRNNQHEPLEDREIPTRPWQQLGVDFFHLKNVNYLLVIDYFSKFIELQPLKSISAMGVINAMKAIFSRFGIPEEIISDNGQPFDSTEYKQFLKDWDINFNPSAPYNPRSNGQAERSVQTLKNSLLKAAEDNKDLFIVLLDYRNTPLEGMASPAELLMGRKIRTFVPSLPQQLTPKYDIRSSYAQLQFRQARQHRYGDKKSKLLSSLQIKQQVWFSLHNKWHPGEIIQIGPQKRTYTVQASNGMVYRRNRYHLKPALGREDQMLASNGTHSIFTKLNSRNVESSSKSESTSHKGQTTRYGRQITSPTRFKD